MLLRELIPAQIPLQLPSLLLCLGGISGAGWEPRDEVLMGLMEGLSTSRCSGRVRAVECSQGFTVALAWKCRIEMISLQTCGKDQEGRSCPSHAVVCGVCGSRWLRWVCPFGSKAGDGLVGMVTAAHLAEGSLGGGVMGAVIILSPSPSSSHPHPIPIPSSALLASGPADPRGFSSTTLFPADLHFGFWR